MLMNYLQRIKYKAKYTAEKVSVIFIHKLKMLPISGYWGLKTVFCTQKWGGYSHEIWGCV